jgi:hypothetical protein
VAYRKKMREPIAFERYFGGVEKHRLFEILYSLISHLPAQDLELRRD